MWLQIISDGLRPYSSNGGTIFIFVVMLLLVAVLFWDIVLLLLTLFVPAFTLGFLIRRLWRSRRA